MYTTQNDDKKLIESSQEVFLFTINRYCLEYWKSLESNQPIFSTENEK